jgi:hypothetical protein
MYSKNMIYIIFTSCWLLLFLSIFLFLDEKTIFLLSKEDGLIETAGAIFFLFASILFFVKFQKKESKKNFFFLFLGCLFLFGFLEEISWGQRIFNITTPQAIQEINRQNEINFHNINIFHAITEDGETKSAWALMLNMSRLFSMFCLVYCCLIPLLYRFHFKTNVFLDRLNLPIVPIFLGVFFVLTYLLAKILTSTYSSIGLGHSINEIKETSYAFLFFILSIWFTKNDWHIK